MRIEPVGYLDYVTQEGDTFDRLALDFYNEETMAGHIVAANRDYCDMVIFDAAVTLRIPVFNQVETVESLPPWRRTS